MSWAVDANKQEKEQKHEVFISQLHEMRLKDESESKFGDKPHLGGIGRGRPMTATDAKEDTDVKSFAGFKNGGNSGFGNQDKPSAGFGSTKAGFGGGFGGFGGGDHKSKQPNNSSFGSFGGSDDNKTKPNTSDDSYRSTQSTSKKDFLSSSAQKVQETSGVTNDDSGEWDKPQTKEEESFLNKILHDKLVSIQHSTIEVQRSDPNSPLYSIKSFEELRLREELLKGVSSMGFTYPSKIQEAALPILLAEPPQNMIAQSQSGTGKTAAFVLTMLSRVDPNKRFPQCLCLAPTYELALQIGKVVETMGKFCPEIHVTYAVRQHKMVRRGEQIEEQIVIGTPGTALDWLQKYKCFDPSEIKVFVLDEADVMISQQGLQDQSVRLCSQMPSDCQRLLFSATFDDDVKEFAPKVVTDPTVIMLRREELPLENIRQYYVYCHSQDDKYRALCNLYGSLTIGQSMIFVFSKKSAAWLAEKMSKDGHAVAMLTADLDITQRANVITRFKEVKERVLICTNLCARGLDVEQVTVVINFDLPRTQDGRPDYETYLHRIGRTGRFGKAGLAINFVDGARTYSLMKQIEDYFGKKIDKLDTEDSNVLESIENRD